MMMNNPPFDNSLTIIALPREIQVSVLTYLRAYDLTTVQQSCRFYNDPDLIHKVVTFTAQHVYGQEETGISSNNSGTTIPGVRNGKYTLGSLRTLELTVVARALSSAEPKAGFYVSKAWVKKTLLWLEKMNEPAPTKKLSKKQQRQRARRLSDVHPPWPDVNGDLLCPHENLQRCNAKSARARRRLMDKQAWKILRKLYPDSTQLESGNGECLQCLMEKETAKKSEEDAAEKAKLERKEPLSNKHVRRVYTRTRGFPTHRLQETSASTPNAAVCASKNSCPLVAGKYYVIPRSWCHQWRRYIKTGDVSMPLPPEASMLLCDAHKFALLPPHLEAFLHGETSQLLSTIKKQPSEQDDNGPSYLASAASRSANFHCLPIGASPPVVDSEAMQALQAAGMSHSEIISQQMAFMRIQGQVAPPAPPRSPAAPRANSTGNTNAVANDNDDDNNEFNQNARLDRENHLVVELVTEEEWIALKDTGCWPKQVSSFVFSLTVAENGCVSYSTQPCRDCDPTGSRFTLRAEIKYRRKRWEPKSVEQKRIPNKLNY
ncbi:unnamed protein product [Cylindrotheca closterium]|uniref:F-box domain-containing protein n=1 Tax=Cylindrotheca closterium TaxID=2856 RepID=A0AAD2GA69_9STRA|nr:unnamed protein product [Cylindrotheca closterium]CAJ1967471.1 unnamed protein product [Cylindrotheca closterium]